METLKWCVRTDLAVENTPEIMEVKFGDGYTQRSPKGLNNLLRAYTGTIKVKKGEHLAVEAFFAKHRGVSPFYFKDPYTRQNKKVVCSSWPAKMVGLTHWEFSVTFKEVP
ncbi:phage tail protein [Mannheimia indoligenes]|uniref:phage tail protein n=1 Tax=Mannheimia indoligenes TaxID=3103145 RepID=UPI002FE5EF5A